MFLSRWGRARRGEFARRLSLQFLEERVTPTTFVVSNLLDGPVSNAGDLPGSLRQAIFDANANPGADVVDATGVSGTIVLAGGALNIAAEVSINGPGANALTINGSGNTAIIGMSPSDFTPYTTTIKNLTITGGYTTGNGGGISGGNYVQFNLSGLIVTGNLAVGSGGGIHCGSLTMADSTISLNKCGGSFFTGGGGIYSGTATLTNCVIRDNQTTKYGGGACFAGKAMVINCEFTNNRTLGTGWGGGIYAEFKLNVVDSLIQQNQSAFYGGGMYTRGETTIVGSKILQNVSEGRDGGGIYHGRFAYPLSIDSTTIADNMSISASGGGLYCFGAKVSITNSTVSGNQTGSSFVQHGGGVYSTNFTIRNSTISSNAAGGNGGGIYGTGVVENSTIISNTALRGGGIYGFGLSLFSSIVADNFGPASSPDIFCAYMVTANACAIGQLAGVNSLNRIGTLLTGTPHLGSLADNGGPTFTHLPLPNSPVRGAGFNPAGLQYDQRGQPRQVGLHTDLGAVESFDPSPTAWVDLPDITQAGAADWTFAVTFEDPDGMATSTIINNANALRVTGPNGFNSSVQYVSIDDVNNGPSRTATFQFHAPGGKFGPEDNGTYQISVQPGQVFDLTDAALSSNYQFALRVVIPWNFVVTNTLDGPVTKSGDLPGSLRQAIFDAAQTPTVDSITFDPIVFGTATTITLTAGELVVRDSVHIAGPGAGLLAIDGNQTSRLFSLNIEQNRLPTITKLSGLTLQHGNSLNGGAIKCTSVNLEIESCVLTNNQAFGAGGAVHSRSTHLVLRNSVVSNNASTDGVGGGIYMKDFATLNLASCTITGNKAKANGGGIYGLQTTNASVAASITIEKSTIANNEARGSTLGGSGGGGICFEGTSTNPNAQIGTLTIRDSAIASNITDASGGGIYVHSQDTLLVYNSIISGNIAGNDGGGIYLFKDNGFLIENSTINHNIADGKSQFSKGGGGLYFWGVPSTFGWTIRNSTISSNTSKLAGGGVLAVTTLAKLNIHNSTITNNTASSGGGGIALPSGTGTVSLVSTIIATNLHGATPDISTPHVVIADHSLIGVTDGIKTLTATKTLTGTLAAPLDPLLAPLADNGGPTNTHVPLPGSPAINRGSNPLNLEFDQRGPGYPRQAGVAPDIGAFEFPLPPVVNAITIADGSAQRSMIRSLTVTFSEAVSFPSGPAAALQLQRTGPGGPTGLVNVVVEQTGNVVMLTFVDPVFAPSPGNSLMDGQYKLTLVSSKIHGTYATLDGNGDGIAGGDVVKSFHRLFGDSDGDGIVSAVDFNALRQVWMTASPVFDFNNDGVVSAVEFMQFRLRYGVLI